MLWMLDPRDRHVPHPEYGRCPSKKHAHASQRHTLRLPMRYRPCKHQRELLPRDARVGRRRHGRRGKYWNPTCATGIVREEAPCMPSRMDTKVHVIEFHYDTQGRRKTSVLGIRIEPVRKNEATHVTSSTVHQAGFNPTIHRQQHARTHAQAKVCSQPAKLFALHARRIHAHRFIVQCADAQNWFPGPGREPLQLLSVVSIRAFLSLRVPLLPVHQQKRIVELARVLRPALRCRQQIALVPFRQPTPIFPVPLQVCHPPRHLKKPQRVLLVARLPFNRPMRLALAVHPMRGTQYRHIFEFVHEKAPRFD